MIPIPELLKTNALLKIDFVAHLVEEREGIPRIFTLNN